MIRRPLRPLARIIAAREQGLDPDRKEAAARLAKAQSRRKREHQRAQLRILLVAVVFLAAFGTIGVRMMVLATTQTPAEIAAIEAKKIISDRVRADNRHDQNQWCKYS